MSWHDNSSNETGFRIYNLDPVMTVPADSTSASFDSFDLPSLSADPCFSVTAYNNAGESAAATACFAD